MAYNPYKDIDSIYNFKGQWDEANNAGNDAKKNEVAAKAQAYYRQLRNNGYGDVADALTASNYTQAKTIRDKWAKTGKTPTRDYLYSLGKGYGMTTSDVDNLIAWDNQSGEVSFGGKKIGAPDTVVDGVSYWGDTSALDSAFKDYIKRTNTPPTSTTVSEKVNSLWGLQNADYGDLSDMYKKEYENLKNTNPFTTEEAKSILAKYDLAGLQNRDNTVASGSSSNGGNIDSFAAANALRQQASLVNQGQMTVLEAYQQKLNHAKSILDGLGVYQQNNYKSMQDTIGLQSNEEQRLFENSETAKNNDVARKSEIASITGNVPDEWVVSDNPYMNDDGTIKEQFKNVDFKAVMNAARASGNTKAANYAAQARYYKLMSDYDKYGQYDDADYIVPGSKQSEPARQFDRQIESAENIAKIGNEAQLAAINAQTASNEKIAAMENNTALAGLASNEKIAAMQANAKNITSKNSTSKTNNSSNNSSKSGSKSSSVPLSEKDVKEWVDWLNSSVSNNYGSEYKALKEVGKNLYKLADVGADYIIKRVSESTDLTQEQKNYLLYDKFGISEDAAYAAARDPHYK